MIGVYEPKEDDYHELPEKESSPDVGVVGHHLEELVVAGHGGENLGLRVRHQVLQEHALMVSDNLVQELHEREVILSEDLGVDHLESPAVSLVGEKGGKHAGEHEQVVQSLVLLCPEALIQVEHLKEGVELGILHVYVPAIEASGGTLEGGKHIGTFILVRCSF